MMQKRSGVDKCGWFCFDHGGLGNEWDRERLYAVVFLKTDNNVLGDRY